jgi:hypothetical protein
LIGRERDWVHRIPLLVLANNNRSYFNDEQHQEAGAPRVKPLGQEANTVFRSDPRHWHTYSDWSAVCASLKWQPALLYGACLRRERHPDGWTVHQ